MSDRDLIAESRAMIASWEADPSPDGALRHAQWAVKAVPLMLNVLEARLTALEAARDRIAALEAAQRSPAEIEAALEYAWDDGNASGLDGWTGPGRGAGEVDQQAIYNRDRAIRTALEKLGETRRPPAGYVVLVRDAEEPAIRLHRSYILHTSLDTAATAEGIASRYADFEGEYFVAEVREVQP